jgi:hypothetical protein
MARRVEEIKRVSRDITDDSSSVVRDQRNVVKDDDAADRYEEEFYDVGEPVEETGLNTASGVLALVLLALAIYLIWAALR